MYSAEGRFDQLQFLQANWSMSEQRNECDSLISWKHHRMQDRLLISRTQGFVCVLELHLSRSRTLQELGTTEISTSNVIFRALVLAEPSHTSKEPCDGTKYNAPMVRLNHIRVVG